MKIFSLLLLSLSLLSYAAPSSRPTLIDSLYRNYKYEKEELPPKKSIKYPSKVMPLTDTTTPPSLQKSPFHTISLEGVIPMLSYEYYWRSQTLYSTVIDGDALRKRIKGEYFYGLSAAIGSLGVDFVMTRVLFKSLYGRSPHYIETGVGGTVLLFNRERDFVGNLLASYRFQWRFCTLKAGVMLYIDYEKVDNNGFLLLPTPFAGIGFSF